MGGMGTGRWSRRIHLLLGLFAVAISRMVTASIGGELFGPLLQMVCRTMAAIFCHLVSYTVHSREGFDD